MSPQKRLFLSALACFSAASAGCQNSSAPLAKNPTPLPLLVKVAPTPSPTEKPIEIQTNKPSLAPLPEMVSSQRVPISAIVDNQSKLLTIAEWEGEKSLRTRLFRVRTRKWVMIWVGGPDDNDKPHALRIDLFNAKGQLVKTLVDSTEISGTVDVAGSGTYYLRIHSLNSSYSIEVDEDHYSDNDSDASTATNSRSLVESFPVRGAARRVPTSPQFSSPTLRNLSGEVWVNDKTQIYHYPGTRWFKNTHDGHLMSEAAAIGAGYTAAANGQ